MTVKKNVPYPTEVALCGAFIERVDKREWTPYAETGGWDILLVRKLDGFQIGIEAKLRMNVEVVNQALEEYGVNREGPDCRAVLVPGYASGGFERIATYIGFTIIIMSPGGLYGRRPEFRPALPKIDDKCWSKEAWHEWAPARRHDLPKYVPDVAAGSPSPIQLTEWKISALKLQAILERNGFVGRGDFRTCGLDHRRWFAPETRWLVFNEKVGGWIKGPRFPNFAGQHPKVFEQVKADLADIEAKAITAQLPLLAGARR